MKNKSIFALALVAMVVMSFLCAGMRQSSNAFALRMARGPQTVSVSQPVQHLPIAAHSL